MPVCLCCCVCVYILNPHPTYIHTNDTQTVWCPNSAWDLFLVKGLGFGEWKLGMLALAGMVLGACVCFVCVCVCTL